MRGPKTTDGGGARGRREQPRGRPPDGRARRPWRLVGSHDGACAAGSARPEAPRARGGTAGPGHPGQASVIVTRTLSWCYRDL